MEASSKRKTKMPVQPETTSIENREERNTQPSSDALTPKLRRKSQESQAFHRMRGCSTNLSKDGRRVDRVRIGRRASSLKQKKSGSFRVNNPKGLGKQ